MRSSGAGTTGFTGLIAQQTKVAQLRGLNERNVFAGDGSRVNGFGFGADGSKATLTEFLADSHRFHGLSENDKRVLERFLVAFPTETPPIVGFTRTLDSKNYQQPSIREDLSVLIQQAGLGNCSISVTGLIDGERIEMVYIRDVKTFRSRVGDPREIDLIQLLSRMVGEDSYLSFVATPN
jgi:hypothetical protein